MPPAFALSQDQTLRFMSCPMPPQQASDTDKQTRNSPDQPKCSPTCHQTQQGTPKANPERCVTHHRYTTYHASPPKAAIQQAPKPAKQTTPSNTQRQPRIPSSILDAIVKERRCERVGPGPTQPLKVGPVSVRIKPDAAAYHIPLGSQRNEPP